MFLVLCQGFLCQLNLIFLIVLDLLEYIIVFSVGYEIERVYQRLEELGIYDLVLSLK